MCAWANKVWQGTEDLLAQAIDPRVIRARISESANQCADSGGDLLPCESGRQEALATEWNRRSCSFHFKVTPEDEDWADHSQRTGARGHIKGGLGVSPLLANHSENLRKCSALYKWGKPSWICVSGWPQTRPVVAHPPIPATQKEWASIQRSKFSFPASVAKLEPVNAVATASQQHSLSLEWPIQRRHYQPRRTLESSKDLATHSQFPQPRTRHI